jgi:hypothetical protein
MCKIWFIRIVLMAIKALFTDGKLLPNLKSTVKVIDISIRSNKTKQIKLNKQKGENGQKFTL